MSYNQSDDEEDNGFLGTPFAPLETDQIVSRKPDLDLTVRDSKGRRRFHGAFTGGFSAGHFMTVGSEEGFTPQQYKSNRQQRWDQSLVQRKPENFMDSEDLDVFGIAPKKIATKEQFVEEEFAGFRKTDSMIDVLKNVIKPTNESIGRKLYKRMKLMAKKDNKYLETKVYGCEPTSNRGADNEFSLASYTPKSNLHGIGYKSMVEENDSSQSKASNGVSATFKSGRKLKISGEAFGYGVLDEDIEEDAVVYHKDDLSQYDFEIGSVRPKAKPKTKGNDILKTDIIEGFVKSFKKIILSENIQNKYPVPVIPKDWKRSSHENKPRKSRWDQTSDGQKTKESSVKSDVNLNSKTPVLNANIRAVLLGEEVIHRQGVKKPEIIPQKKDSNIGFNENIVKESSIEKQKQIFPEKPLFGFWANKFTRSSNGPEESTLSGGLTEFKSTQKDSSLENETKLNEKNNVIERTTYEWHPHTLLCKRFNIPNPFPQYPDFVGVVTVGKSDVRNRTSRISDKKVAKTQPNIFESLFSEQISSDPLKPLTNENNTKSVQNSNEAEDKDNNSDEENEDPTRPPMDLFKAIFASDEESDSEDIEVDRSGSKQTSEDIESKDNSNESKTRDLSANKGKGIFANIDFDQLNRDFTPHLNETQNLVQNESKNEKTLEQPKDIPKSSEPNDDLYGPALPPDLSFFTPITVNKDFDEKNSKSSKRKKKTKKQKKHKKQKTSHKKHKHKHRKSSDSESSSEEDIEQQILEKLKSARK